MNLGMLIFIVSAVWIISEIILARVRHSASGSAGLDRFSLRIIWITIIVSIAAGYWVAAHHYGMFRSGGRIAAWAGLALIIGGLAFRWWAILSLRNHFTVDVAINEDHRLVTSGIYRTIRHPAYGGSLLSFLGLGLVFSSWLSLLVIFVPILCAFLYRIRIEEQALISHFGDEYLGYMARTSRIIPKVF